MSQAKVASIADTEEYKEFELRHNRHLNMVGESDRNLRRQALNEFKKAIANKKNDKIIEYFYRERLCKRMVLCLSDVVEKNREIAIEILQDMVERFGFKEESQIMIPAICQRMTKLPYPESSEEVRVQLIELTEVCLEAESHQFVPHVGILCGMLAKAAQDANPEMKTAVALFAGKVALALDRKVGAYLKGTIDSMVSNLSHQHSKVRKTTLIGLRDVCSASGAEAHLEGGNMLQFKFAMNDRSQDVRATFYEVLFHWMKKIEIHYLRVYEAEFIQFLLNGIADDKLDIGPKCIQFLEEHSQRMREALKALGEDEEMESKEEDVKIGNGKGGVFGDISNKYGDSENMDMIRDVTKNVDVQREQVDLPADGTAMEDID